MFRQIHRAQSPHIDAPVLIHSADQLVSALNAAGPSAKLCISVFAEAPDRQRFAIEILDPSAGQFIPHRLVQLLQQMSNGKGAKSPAHLRLTDEFFGANVSRPMSLLTSPTDGTIIHHSPQKNPKDVRGRVRQPTPANDGNPIQLLTDLSKQFAFHTCSPFPGKDSENSMNANSCWRKWLYAWRIMLTAGG
jgi:hypothetical protein